MLASRFYRLTQSRRHGAGGFAFAASPSCPAPQARLLWDARYDGSVLPVEAVPASGRQADTFDLGRLSSLATVVARPDGGECVVLSDGYRHIRIDVVSGTLRGGPVRLFYNLQGFARVEEKILTLRRFLALCRLGRFARDLHPREHQAPRWLAALRALDAANQGASQREISSILFGEKLIGSARDSGSDFLRLRVQRLVRSGKKMVAGGYLSLLR